MGHSVLKPFILGGLVALCLLVMAMLMGGPLLIFFDPTSVLILVGGTLMLTLAAHGWAGWAALLLGTLRMLIPATMDGHWGRARCLEVSRVAGSAGNIAIIMAGCGAMIGLTQMLAHLDDPSKLGAGVAVIFLAAGATGLDNGLRVPPMGWSSWYGFTSHINETLFRQTGDGLISSGLAAAGYSTAGASTGAGALFCF